jgi:hypothetical protein
VMVPAGSGLGNRWTLRRMWRMPDLGSTSSHARPRTPERRAPVATLSSRGTSQIVPDEACGRPLRRQMAERSRGHSQETEKAGFDASRGADRPAILPAHPPIGSANERAAVRTTEMDLKLPDGLEIWASCVLPEPVRYRKHRDGATGHPCVPSITRCACGTSLRPHPPGGST